jgi:hypothetical protein
VSLEDASQGRAGGEEAAHPVHAAARGRGRRADVEAPDRGRVRHDPRHRPSEELPQVLEPAINIAPDVIGVVPLEVDRRQDVPRQDAITADFRGRETCLIRTQLFPVEVPFSPGFSGVGVRGLECPIGKLSAFSAGCAPSFLHLRWLVDPAGTRSFPAFTGCCSSATPGVKPLPG